MKRYAGIVASLFLVLGFSVSALAAGQWMTTREAQPEYYFNDISFSNKKNGLAVGESIFDFEGDPGYGVVARTTDGGTTWEIVTDNPADYILSAVHFVTPKVGFAAGDRGLVMGTKDGGQSWAKSVTNTDNWLYDIYFIDEKRGWAVGMGETIITNGRTWKVLQGGQLGSGAVGDDDMIVYNAVHFVNEKTGWAAGLKLVQQQGQDAYIVRTDDGGQNWTQQATGKEDTLHDIYFVDADNGWAVGQYGMILHTSDGGANWSAQTSPTEEDLTSVCFADQKRGWAVGKYGTGSATMIETSDGGQTWTLIANEMKRSLEGVDVADARNAWVTGDGGLVLRYAE